MTTVTPETISVTVTVYSPTGAGGSTELNLYGYNTISSLIDRLQRRIRELER